MEPITPDIILVNHNDFIQGFDNFLSIPLPKPVANCNGLVSPYYDILYKNYGLQKTNDKKYRDNGYYQEYHAPNAVYAVPAIEQYAQQTKMKYHTYYSRAKFWPKGYCLCHRFIPYNFIPQSRSSSTSQSGTYLATS